MAETQGAPDLRMGGLSDRYEIRGELRGTEAGRTYIGRPRDGSAEVAITVVSLPKGANNNELSHFAADVNILETTSHPSLIRVLDGQWVGAGKNEFSIVTERVQGESLAELLDRGERFSNPRIALMLQEVSGVLDWAREKGIVHRTVTPDTILFERDTNRLRMMFAPAPIPITGVATEAGDARTLGALAWAMFTGERYDPTTAPKSLGDVCPNLATRVIEATDRAIACKEGSTPPDIATFLGVIGSGDVMKQAEVEMAA
ncbi:MAG TPA: protein kinase, partial [Gemmatimonadaceae bacterium]